MKKTYLLTTLTGVIAAGIMAFSANTLACDGMGPDKHMGSITSVNAADKTFTIRDAQLQIPITFKASDEIIQAVKGETGKSIQVNFEDEGGTLTALGVIL